MQIKQKLSKQIMSLSNGYISKAQEAPLCCQTPGRISKAHVQAPGAVCIRNSISPKYLWPEVLLPKIAALPDAKFPSASPFPCRLDCANVGFLRGVGAFCQCGL